MIAKNVFGIVGWQNSGKTTLIEALLAEFAARGLRVSTIKHAHHAFDIDIPGKDSHRHRTAGAHEVLVASGARWAIMHELHSTPEPSLEDLLQRLAPCDLILVEGFKNGTHPKIEVIRHASAEPRLADTNPTVRAIATDDPLLAGPHRVLSLHDVRKIARFICTTCEVAAPRFDSDQ